MMIKEDLLRRLATKESVIGILGLGYVGLPLMLRFSEVGYRVLGFDIDARKVEKLNAGMLYCLYFLGSHPKSTSEWI